MKPLALRFTLAAVVAGMLILDPGPVRGDDWSNLGLTDTRARMSSERSGVSFGQAQWLCQLTASDPERFYRGLPASPAIADGYVVFATQKSVVRALRETDGRLLWEVKVGSTVLASPAIWRGLVFVVDASQQLFALRLTDGSVVWDKALGGLGLASPLVSGDALLVAVGSPAPRVLRIEPATGRTVWEAGESILSQAVAAAVASQDGHIVVAEVGGHYHSFALSDGKWQWTAQARGSVQMSSPFILGGRVFAVPGGETARLHAFGLDQGSALSGWPHEVPVPALDSKGGRLVRREHQVSSLAGTEHVIVFGLRTDDLIDTDGDREADRFIMQEQVTAIDPATGKVLWSMANGQVDTRDGNSTPMEGLVPTPLLYQTPSGQMVVAVASTLSNRVRVLGATDGAELWGQALSGPSRSSPALANGRLVLATDAGVVHGLLSDANRPPLAPLLGFRPTDGHVSAAEGTTLHWGAGFDPEGQSVRYQVRVDDDGEVLRDWDFQVETAPGQQSWAPGVLISGRVYTFAVRARDALGAYSEWSRPQSFSSVATPSIHIGERVVATLDEAVTVAKAGDTITLGAGTFQLGSTVQLPAGVNLAGAAPHQTILSGKGLAVAVAPGAGSTLRSLTVRDARLGVSVEQAENVVLQNVILRGNTEAGLDVGPASSARLISATLLENGIGVRARGATHVRNGLITRNQTGLEAAAPQLFDLLYNDVFGNQVADYRNVNASRTDLSVAVAFDEADPGQARLRAAQPTTDKGDPADEFDKEPEPNGKRINLGAFGNTPFAELSATPSSPGTGSEPPPPPPGDTSGRRSSGGGLCSLGAPGGDPEGAVWVVIGVLLVARRRRRRVG
jgi:outer membrane protein assembly factor BamB